MFHLFNSVYLADKALYQGYTHSIVIDEVARLKPRHGLYFKQYPSWEMFVDSELQGHSENFWKFIYDLGESGQRYIVFLNSENLLKLQIVFWKTVLPHITIEGGFDLHKIYFEDCMLRCHLPEHMLNQEVKTAYRSYKLLNYERFQQQWNDAEKSPYLGEISKDLLSFEYQLGDYFVNSDTPVKPALLKKIGHFSWVNWVSEIFILKTDIINAILDVNNLLPEEHHIDTSVPGAIYSQIIGNRYLNWILDDQIQPRNYEYVEKNYSREMFKFLYDRFYSLWQVNGEDMAELIDLIYDHQYEELLIRDVGRRFGSVYSSNRFQDRINQVLVSLLYRLKRENRISELRQFSLY